jgi:hypothetical protein
VGMSDRTANLASLAAGAFTGSAASGFAKAGIRGIVTQGFAEGAKQVVMQLGAGGVCELTREILSNNEATKPYANAINEALAGAMQAQAGGGGMTVAAVKAAFGLVRGTILDGNLAIPEEQRSLVLMGLSLAEQAAASAVQNQLNAGDEAGLDGADHRTSEPEEVLSPDIGMDDEPLVGMPQPTADAPVAQVDPAVTSQETRGPSATTTSEDGPKRIVIKLGDREVTIGGGKGITFQGKKWSVEAGRSEGLLVERSATNAAGDNNTHTLSIGAGKGAELVSSQTKSTGEAKIVRVGAGGGEGMRIERSRGARNGEVTHASVGLGGRGAAASLEKQHFHDGGVESSTTKLLPHGAAHDGKGITGALGTSESTSTSTSGGSRTNKVELLPLAGQRQGNIVSGSAALLRESETVAHASGGSTTADTSLLSVAGSVIKDRSTIGATASGAVGNLLVTKTGQDGSLSRREMTLVPIAGEGFVGNERTDTGTTYMTAAKGSIAAARFEGHEHHLDGSKASGKLVVSENAWRGQASATKGTHGELHASTSGSSTFTVLRGHGEQTTTDGTRTEVGGVFGQHVVSGQGSASMSKEGLAVAGTGSIHDSVVKVAAEQTMADGSQRAGSVDLGDWRRDGSVAVRGSSEGSHVNGKLEEHRTLASVAGAQRDASGISYSRSARLGQRATTANATIDAASHSTTFRGDGSIHERKLEVAAGRVGVDGEKTTVGAVLGASDQQARGTLVHSAEGLRATGQESSTSSKLRFDQRHTTARGSTETLDGVVGESSRTRKGDLLVDELGRRTIEHAEGSKETRYRLAASIASAEHELMGGVKGQVRASGLVEDSTSHATTVRRDANGRRTETSTAASGPTSLADLKAILRNRSGEVLCSVGVDLKAAQTHEAARYSASKINAWIQQMIEAPAQAEGEEPIESVIDLDDDMREKSWV